MMKWNYMLGLAFAASLMLAPAAHAQTSTWTIDANHSQADFQVRHLAVSNVRGSISGVKGAVVLDEKDITKSSVDASLAAGTVNTSNARRDTDLKSERFFDVDKFPGISFKSTAITKIDGKLKITGDLTLRDVTKSVTLDLDGPAPPQKNPQTGKLVSGFSASGMIKRSDFNFGNKSPASGTIGDDIKFTIDIEIAKND
ncbi:MAG: YceI family protein [Granulicella sp.]